MRIIYLDIDSLRPDHTEPYGYERPITPNLAELAKESVTFDRYYCSDSPCMPSRAALSSQQFGITNGVAGHVGEASRLRFGESSVPPKNHYMHDVNRPLLGGYLAEAGLYTASISCFAERHLAYWFQGNFRETIKPSNSLGNDEDAADVNAAAFSWLERNGQGDDWFLHVNYWEPHTSYIQPVEWFRKVAEELGEPPEWPDEETIAAHADIYGPHSAQDLHYLEGGSSPRLQTMPESISDREDFEKLVNGYDSEIYYWDYHLGQLLNKLDDLGILEDTVIIVSADHGESLGENGSYAEHGLANEPTHRIPLIVRWPGITTDVPDDKRRSGAMLYNLDLGPTLCELLGLEIPQSWHGISFAPALRGEYVEGRAHLIFSQGAHTFQRAVRTEDYLYISTLHPGSFKAEPEQLFNVSEDPYLTRNLISDNTREADSLKALLMDWWNEYAGFPGAPPDPMLRALDEGPRLYTDSGLYIRHLSDTGRPDSAEDLRTRLRQPR